MVKIDQLEGLGTHWWFEFFDASEADSARLKMYLEQTLKTFNDTYSRFKSGSLIHTLNTTGELPLNTVANTDELIELLQFGQKLHSDTNGVFNFLTGGTQIMQGYGASDSIRSLNDESTPNPTTDLEITGTFIRLHHGAVDLGGYGKGWLIDHLAKNIKATFDINHLLINGGGDMYASSDLDGSSIEIVVEHPFKPGLFIAKIPLLHQGFAASSTYKRRWIKEQKTYNHIISAQTADIAAHIVADTAAAADVFGTYACATDVTTAQETLDTAGYDYLILNNESAHYSQGFKAFLLS